MSTLFGHVKGSYTGATSDRAGLLRAADGGLLFLDEIGELRLDEQTMLLRAIEEKRFTPVGADTEVGSDFQLLAGTNRDLAKEITAGRFREDLFARINLWTYQLPGLRDRRDDIEPNLDYELNRFTELTGKRIAMNKEARHAFLKFATAPEAMWTGNFRDLTAAVTRMATSPVAAESTKPRFRRRWIGSEPAGKQPTTGEKSRRYYLVSWTQKHRTSGSVRPTAIGGSDQSLPNIKIDG